jgi:hypothetical protein
VLVYGTGKGKEFYIGGEPETTFNPVVHNLTEMGDLDADDINFGLGFYLTDNEFNPKSLDSIDKRFLQFEVKNMKISFDPEPNPSNIGTGKIVKCSDLKNSKISKLLKGKILEFNPVCVDFKGLKFNSAPQFGPFTYNSAPKILNLTLKRCNKYNTANLPTG